MNHARGEGTALRQDVGTLKEKVDYTLLKVAEHDAKFMAIKRWQKRVDR